MNLLHRMCGNISTHLMTGNFEMSQPPSSFIYVHWKINVIELSALVCIHLLKKITMSNQY